jgi:hypothetical protein
MAIRQKDKLINKKEEIMCKRMLTILLAFTGITLIGLGAISEAVAGPSTIKVKELCENITFDVVGPVKNEAGGFDYTYTLNSGKIDVQNVSYVSLGFDRSVTITNAALVLGAGNSDGWLSGAPLKTYTVEPQEVLTHSFVINAVGEEKGEVFAYVKAGRDIESCVIEGPGVPPPCPGLPIDVTVPLTKQVSLNGVDYCIDIDPRTGCPYPDSVPYNCVTKLPLLFDGDFVLGNSTTDTNGAPTTPTMIMGEGSDPRCPVAKAAHNPCQWIILTGRPYGPICW